MTASTGPNNFFLRDAHLWRHAGEYGGLHKVTAFKSVRTTDAANANGGALLDANPDVVLHSLELQLVDHWAHGHLRVERVPYFTAFASS